MLCVRNLENLDPAFLSRIARPHWKVETLKTVNLLVGSVGGRGIIEGQLGEALPAKMIMARDR
jgi:hypothetical protein